MYLSYVITMLKSFLQGSQLMEAVHPAQQQVTTSWRLMALPFNQYPN